MQETSFGPVLCGKCGASLSEPTGLPEERRKPCPECGSKKRSYAVNMTTEVKALTTLLAEGRRAGMNRTKGWFKRILTGQVPQRDRDGAIAAVDRIFDRDADRYIERVVIQKSGEVLHDVDEPLSAHRGHGSDRPKVGASKRTGL